MTYDSQSWPESESDKLRAQLHEILEGTYRRTTGKPYATLGGGSSNMYYEDCTHQLETKLLATVHQYLREQVEEAMLRDITEPCTCGHDYHVRFNSLECLKCSCQSFTPKALKQSNRKQEQDV